MPRQGFVVAQLGARRHYAVARALHRSQMLERLVTDACATIPPWSWLDSVLPTGMRPAPIRRLLGRRPEGIPESKIQGFPWFALSAAWEGGRGESRSDYWARRNARFGRLVVDSGIEDARAVYAYNGAALEIFQFAKDSGLKTVLDQTAAPWRWNARLLREEASRWPGWEARPAELDESGLLAQREEAEWALADRIVCGSPFVVEALAELGGPRERCAVVPYAAPQASASRNASCVPATARPGALRVLFVGTLQLRKGLPYLLDALRSLPKGTVEARVVGPSLLSAEVLGLFRDQVDLLDAVPRSEMGKQYEWADVLVLPTLSEGSANVIVEAMARGLPVVTTPNAGSIIRDGENGLLVPIRDSEALASAMLRLSRDAALRGRLGAAAAHSAPAFDTYAACLVRAVESEAA
jgi:glycosyltransferase involved in cell wall biosynthesis